MIAVVERMDIFVTGIASAGCVATGASHKCQTGGNSRWAPSSDRFGLRGAERERPLLIFVTVSNGHEAAGGQRPQFCRKNCLQFPAISPQSGSLNQQGVHHGKHH